MNTPHLAEAGQNISTAPSQPVTAGSSPSHPTGSEAADSSFTDRPRQSSVRGDSEHSQGSPSAGSPSALVQSIGISEHPTEQDLKTLAPQIEQDLYEAGERLLAELHLIRQGLLPNISRTEWEAKAQRCCELLGIEEGMERNFIQDFVINTKLWPDLLLKYEAMGFAREFMAGRRLQARLLLMHRGLLPGLSETEWIGEAHRCCRLLGIPADEEQDFIRSNLIHKGFKPQDMVEYQRIGAIDVVTHRAILRTLLDAGELPEIHPGWFNVLTENGVLDAGLTAELLSKFPGCDEPYPLPLPHRTGVG
jgi:hypothetical protein